MLDTYRFPLFAFNKTYMKHFYLLLLFFISITVSAQNRIVLIEEFTNTGCNPCAAWSPELDAVIENRLGDCIAIKYHSSYPNRNDEFYNYDPVTQQKRHDFYEVDGVPATFVNGEALYFRTSSYLEETINQQMALPERYSLTLSKGIEDHKMSVQANLTPLEDVTNSASLRLFVAAIEEHIIPSKPYPNGETALHYTMRKMFTGGDGYLVGDGGLNVGQDYSYSVSWDIDFCDDEDQLGVIAFLQNIETKEVLCAAYSGAGADKENRLSVVALTDTPDLICVPDYYGHVILRNDGSNTLTTATLNVKVNGAVKQYPWTGSLQYLERDTLAFDGFQEFPLADDENQVELWFSNVNGSTTESNRINSTFSNSLQANYGVQLRFYTDKKPEETTWKLYNSLGEVVREGGPYTEPRKLYTENFELTRDDCYLLEFLDAGNDGIKGNNGNGYYQLYQIDDAGQTHRLTQGDYTGAVCDVFFNLKSTPGNDRRLVLFEEFTNTSCEPCSEFSPSLDKVIANRMDDMVAITYHLNFPSNRDPFYLANPEEAMERAELYDVSGVPSLRVDGEHRSAWGYEEYLDMYIDNAAAIPAKVDIDTEARLDEGKLTVNVSLSPKNVIQGADLRLYVVAVEERVEWETPAPNGEKSWNYVMRKMLPSACGESLPADWSQNTTLQYEYTWEVANYYDENELGIVTFVQDNNTHEILGTCYTPRPTGSPRAVKILQIANTPDRICIPQFSSDLTVRNIGRETITQATVNVSINGQVQSTPWTGSMPYLGIATISTPMFNDFTLNDGASNNVEIWLSNLNGGTEESLHKTLNIANAIQVHHAVRLTLMTDNAPEEITWKVYNSADEVVCEGGPYTEKRKKQVIDLPLNADDCYRLEFEDAGGDGITGANGRGYYMLHQVDADGATKLLVQADYEGARHQVFFSLSEASSVGVIEIPVDETTGSYYDLQGCKALPVRGIYIYDDKKIIKK